MIMWRSASELGFKRFSKLNTKNFEISTIIREEMPTFCSILEVHIICITQWTSGGRVGGRDDDCKNNLTYINEENSKWMREIVMAAILWWCAPRITAVLVLSIAVAVV